MNCRNFETTITEFARGQMLEARMKEEVFTHVEDCQRCAAHFADEQALTAGLHSLAANTPTAAAPHVEEALLLAFRQRRDMPSSPAVTLIPTKVMPRWMPWSIAAAAALIVTSALAVLHLLPLGSRESTPQESSVSSTVQVPSTSPPQESAPDYRNVIAPHDLSQEPKHEMKPSYAVYGKRNPVQPNRLNAKATPGGINSDSMMGARQEIATDFLPLTSGSDLTQLDEGQIIRVELPRSTLQSFGLPMNVERASERVKADVLLGPDGIARAIRFVR